MFDNRRIQKCSSAEEGLRIEIMSATYTFLAAKFGIYILIQIEEQWGDRKVFIDLQDKVIPVASNTCSAQRL